MTEEKADQIIRCVKECWWRVGILITLILSGGLVARYGWPSIGEDAMGWAQLAVACAAILGTIYAAREGARASAQLKEDRVRLSVLAVAKSFLEKVESIVSAASEPADHNGNVSLSFYETYTPSSLDGFVNAMDAVSALELPTPAAILAMLELKRSSRFFVSAADALNAGVWLPGSSTYDYLVKLRENYESARKMYPVGALETQRCQKKLMDAISMNYDSRKSQLKGIAENIRSYIDTLSRELG